MNLKKLNIIGIAGLAGSGKDTVGDLLLENKSFVKVSLADPMKRFAKEMWNFTDEQLWGSSEFRNTEDKRYLIGEDNNGKNIYLTPRKVLQHIGTEISRYLDPDVWIRKTIETSKVLLTQSGWSYSKEEGLKLYTDNFPKKVEAIVISDVRFENEIKYIKQNGGFLIKVIRPNAGLKGKFGNHQSESEISNVPHETFDYIINNNKTLDDLKQSVNIFKDTFLYA